MMRAFFALLISVWLVAPAAAQTQQEGEMRLYIQQLEERIRQLTGENERLVYELNQVRASLGQPPLQPRPGRPGADRRGAARPAARAGGRADRARIFAPGAPPQDLGTFSVAPNDPLIAPDGVDDSAPVDLSTLGGRRGGRACRPRPAAGRGPRAWRDPDQQMAGLPAAPSPTTALSARRATNTTSPTAISSPATTISPRRPSRPGSPPFRAIRRRRTREFWLGESHLQQGEYRDAANAFLAVYKTAPDSTKGPDALLKLGVSLSALGEKTAACGTLGGARPALSARPPNR